MGNALDQWIDDCNRFRKRHPWVRDMPEGEKVQGMDGLPKLATRQIDNLRIVLNHLEEYGLAQPASHECICDTLHLFGLLLNCAPTAVSMEDALHACLTSMGRPGLQLCGEGAPDGNTSDLDHTSVDNITTRDNIGPRDEKLPAEG